MKKAPSLIGKGGLERASMQQDERTEEDEKTDEWGAELYECECPYDTASKTFCSRIAALLPQHVTHVQIRTWVEVSNCFRF